MFKRNYKYFVSYFYELNNSEFHIGDAFFTTNKKIEKEHFIVRVRSNLRDEIERVTKQKCNFISIISWRKLK